MSIAVGGARSPRGAARLVVRLLAWWHRPGRAQVAEAGPWWDTQTPRVDLAMDAHEVAEMETRLAETDGLRPALQAQARAELTAEGMPVIRSTVARRACAILDLHQLP